MGSSPRDIPTNNQEIAKMLADVVPESEELGSSSMGVMGFS